MFCLTILSASSENSETIRISEQMLQIIPFSSFQFVHKDSQELITQFAIDRHTSKK